MTKSTSDVSSCFVFKSSPEAFISPLFFKKSFTFTLFGLHLEFYLATPLNSIYQLIITHILMGMIQQRDDAYIFLNIFVPSQTTFYRI